MQRTKKRQRDEMLDDEQISSMINPKRDRNLMYICLSETIHIDTQQETSMRDKLCYSVRDAASQLSLSRTKMFELIARGELQSFKLDGKRLVPGAALEDLVARKLAEQESVRSAVGFDTRV